MKYIQAKDLRALVKSKHIPRRGTHKTFLQKKSFQKDDKFAKEKLKSHNYKKKRLK